MALTVIGTSILLSEIDNLLRIFLPPPAWFSDYLKSLVGGQISLWGSIVGLVIVAPLTEELLVRGLILRGFLSHYSKRKAILASAIFFGVLHLNPWQFIGATVLGVLFAWWFIQTRSMFPCFFGHALANALPLAVTAIFRLEIPGFTIDFEKVEFQPLWLDCLGVVLVALGIWLLIHQFRKSSDTVPEDMSGDGSDQL
jgi:membrane protease YdiL (CAAX protease family)